MYRIRIEGIIASDLFIYIDDLRITGPTETECWEGAHQVYCQLTWLGLQDAPWKKNYATQTPHAWAGSIVHSDNGEVTVLVSEEKWGKTKRWIVDWVLDNIDKEVGINHKELTHCCGFLIYVSRTYYAFKPYLRGLHKTIDSWRPGRDEEGWKIMESIIEERGAEEDIPLKAAVKLNDLNPDEYVNPVPRLKDEFEVLKKLTSFDAPPKVIRRRNTVATVCYGFR